MILIQSIKLNLIVVSVSVEQTNRYDVTHARDSELKIREAKKKMINGLRLLTIRSFIQLKIIKHRQPQQESELNRCVIFVNSIANNYNKKRFDVAALALNSIRPTHKAFLSYTKQ